MFFVEKTLRFLQTFPKRLGDEVQAQDSRQILKGKVCNNSSWTLVFFFLPFSLGFLSTGGGLLSMELMLEGEAMLLELEVWGINVRKNTDMHSRMRCFIVWSDLGVLIVCSL